MADGIVTLPRAGTVEVIQEFGQAPSAPARPTLSPVVIGSSFQVEEKKFAGFYQGRFIVGDELVGVGNGVQSAFFLTNQDVLTSTVELHAVSISGLLLVNTTDYTVLTTGEVTLTPAGIAALGLSSLHAKYSFAPAQNFVYPDLRQGAEVESPASDVTVYLKTVEDIFDITDGFSVAVDENSALIPGDIQPSRSVTGAHGQFESVASLTQITDLSQDFFALGVRSGDTMRLIANPVDLERPDSIVGVDTTEHIVLTITSTNTFTFSPPIGAQGGKVEYEIVRNGSQDGEVLISYKARRKDLIGILLEFDSVTTLDDQLGPIVPENPLAYALSKCLGATDKIVFGMMVEDQDDLVDHQKALDVLEGEEVYMMVPLTSNPAIHQVYAAHAGFMSDSESMRERRTIFTHKATQRHVFSDLRTTGSLNVGSTTFTDAGATFITDGVPVGSVIRLVAPDAVELADVDRTELIVAGIISQTALELIQAVTKGTEILNENVALGTGAQVNFQLAATSNVIISSVIMFLNGIQQSALSYSANPNGQVTFVIAPGLNVPVTASYEIIPITGIQYTIESQELTNFEIAKDVAAVGEGYSSRRVTVTFADKVVADDGSEIEPYFMNAAIAGLVSSLAPNQPIANVPIPGFTAVKHIRKFTETHFGVMAGGGISVFIQDRVTSPITLRNWITTDVLNVNTRECSIVNMADFYAKFLRNNISAIAGRFNITTDFIDNMLRPGINGVNRELITAGFIGSKTQIISIEQSTVEKDRLFVLEELELFAPANRITITVRIL
jgi:hypothetical protein